MSVMILYYFIINTKYVFSMLSGLNNFYEYSIVFFSIPNFSGTSIMFNEERNKFEYKRENECNILHQGERN